MIWSNKMIYVVLSIILCLLTILVDKKNGYSVFSDLPTYKYILYYPYLVLITFFIIIGVVVYFIDINLSKFIPKMLKLIGLKTY